MLARYLGTRNMFRGVYSQMYYFVSSFPCDFSLWGENLPLIFEESIKVEENADLQEKDPFEEVCSCQENSDLHEKDPFEEVSSCQENSENLQEFESHSIFEQENHDFDVKQEEKTLDNTKTYECDFCDKTFSRPDNVTRHIKAVHEGKKPFPCEECDKSFAEKRSLNHHMLSFHEEKMPLSQLKSLKESMVVFSY